MFRMSSIELWAMPQTLSGQGLSAPSAEAVACFDGSAALGTDRMYSHGWSCFRQHRATPPTEPILGCRGMPTAWAHDTPR